MTQHTVDLFIIGAGPGGYVAAIKAAQLGLSVAIVDKRATLGGTCLNVGCIPSKALLSSSHKYYEVREGLETHGIEVENLKLSLKTMMARKDSVVDELTRGVKYLMTKNKITVIQGHGAIVDPHHVCVTTPLGDTVTYNAKNILVATGSESVSLPDVEIDEERILSSTGALALPKVPKHLVVIGGGYIGLELGSVWARLGAAVTIVEYASTIAGMMDQEVSSALQKALEAQGIVFRLNRKVVRVVKKGREVHLHLQSSDAANGDIPDVMSTDVVLVCVGRRPVTHSVGLEAVGVQCDARGFIPVNRHFQTACPSVFAIGDIIYGPMLAHKAEKEGICVAEYLAGKPGLMNPNVIPAVVYTHPEAASVGLTEEEVKASGVVYKSGKFPFKANSRAKTAGETTGFVKVLTNAQTDRVLGVHIIGDMAGTMIAQAAMAMEFQASAEDIARMCHAHPTHSEAVKEAAYAAYAKPIHL